MVSDLSHKKLYLWDDIFKSVFLFQALKCLETRVMANLPSWSPNFKHFKTFFKFKFFSTPHCQTFNLFTNQSNKFWLLLMPWYVLLSPFFIHQIFVLILGICWCYSKWNNLYEIIRKKGEGEDFFLILWL